MADTTKDTAPKPSGTTDQANTEQREDAGGTPTIDVVAMPSLRADGTPDQTPGFKQLVDDKDDPRTDS